MDNWISVEERLPEEGVPVLVVDPGPPRSVTVARRHGEEWVSVLAWFINGEWDCETNAMVFVTHWQPLPEPPTPPRSNVEETERW